MIATGNWKKQLPGFGFKQREHLQKKSFLNHRIFIILIKEQLRITFSVSFLVKDSKSKVWLIYSTFYLKAADLRKVSRIRKRSTLRLQSAQEGDVMCLPTTTNINDAPDFNWKKRVSLTSSPFRNTPFYLHSTKIFVVSLQPKTQYHIPK